jgi:hypothetical protein
VLERGFRLRRNDFLIAALCAMTLCIAAAAEPISVRHIQGPMHRLMIARSETGKIIASGEFSQVVQGDKNGNMHVESHHIDLPDDLANGFVGTLLLNVPQNTTPFRVGMLAPVGGGRLVRLLISREGEQPFRTTGQALKATEFRIHPELGGIVGVIASLIGLQPKDVMVWILEGEEPAVVRIVGQLGGYGPVVTSELEGTSFGK